MSQTHWGWLALSLTLACVTSGCGIAPKSFARMNDPAGLTRARSVGLGENLPKQKVVPALIDKLEDHDPVVRLVAYEELKKETGKSFGYLPWGADNDRAGAVSRWRGWWKDKQGSLVRLGQNN